MPNPNKIVAIACLLIGCFDMFIFPQIFSSLQKKYSADKKVIGLMNKALVAGGIIFVAASIYFFQK
ncbi:MAG: hypothetical protein A3G33_06240 [Omnitrophica bacterium RIFCSPLOWO2_12_FULL_44_17]|uniref:Uncharacterized protein n=1 Tax=Candidatus Danuiimicrobium aquiferis TaxID=1801832 RepID=A0A1G1KVB9_9BACT|nr:MAG: hypothetical protein A3B72_04785 [Omnitrophica bacterium RIFCSPHIGHO2_02_FULL_45_28]OGW88703.1 MAG: hypothetical protein A3E74_09565 [Omnitrophica bacterium RIFCSPHIGHO2_12_FULL_44_12]OGW96883.1 MAG: hypothetical protein A3G33_06240 [Omnitrophica bacterium RIFCSPLOWO2_12_FULL_44_17]OGX02416.1 MAG: hypothetical protein A3J12_04985 [Omnitrophica bacterium RIFCSPLOWO2_02_FULL_44_11]